MSIIEEVLKAIQATITPELVALKERVDAHQRETLLHFENMQREMNLRFDGINARFDSLMERLALDQRLEAVERELDEKRKAS
jgi:hypothetical protein